MNWSVSFFKDVSNNDMARFTDGNTALMIHYCGDTRSHELGKMRGNQILDHFRQYFYSQLSAAEIIADRIQDKITGNNAITQILYRQNLRIIHLANRMGRPDYY
jgi:hypothetical protein